MIHESQTPTTTREGMRAARDIRVGLVDRGLLGNTTLVGISFEFEPPWIMSPEMAERVARRMLLCVAEAREKNAKAEEEN